MNTITVPAPLGTLLTTRQPQPVATEGIAGVLGLPVRQGYMTGGFSPDGVPRPRFVEREGPMVAQWITVPEPPPDGVIGQRVMFHQDGARRSTVPVPLGCVVGSGVIAECLPIEGHTGRDRIVRALDRDELTVYRVTSKPGEPATSTFEDISDQLPFNDWSPGRWALRVEGAEVVA